jgi:hypothetical protein
MGTQLAQKRESRILVGRRSDRGPEPSAIVHGSMRARRLPLPWGADRADRADRAHRARRTAGGIRERVAHVAARRAHATSPPWLRLRIGT